MKNYKQWDRRVKTLFFTRLLLVLITLAGTIGIGIAAATGDMDLDAITIVIIVISAFLFVFASLNLFKLIQKINEAFEKINGTKEALSDPEFFDASVAAKNAVNNLDNETIRTIWALEKNEEVSKVEAARVLVKTEGVLEILDNFETKYPDKLVQGVKNFKSLRNIYSKRIELLNNNIIKK